MAVATAIASSPAARLERPNLPRLDSLTGLRFFAAYMVLMYHFTNFAQLPLIWRWSGFGTTGVSFFFVLSGKDNDALVRSTGEDTQQLRRHLALPR